MSLLTDLFSTLDKRSLTGIGDALGESDQTVSRGMQSSIATLLGGLASKSETPNLLRRMLDLTPSGPGGVSWSSLASSVTDPNSPGISAGRNMLSTLFGNAEGPITQALGMGTGLQSGLLSTLMTMCAPMVMGFLGKRVRDQGMNVAGLGGMLQREVPAIREALPAGVNDLIWPRGRETVVESPVVAQTVTRQRSAAGWLVPLILLAMIPLIWLLSRGHKTVVQTPPPVSGTANRVIPAPAIPETPRVTVPENVDLYFDTGSTRLKAESQAKLDQFANALAANRDAHVTVSGYTDNKGSAAGNMRLSQQRAEVVRADLIKRGIAADRLSAQGFGEENPVADNATAEGRGLNRHVSVGAGTQ